MLDSEGKVKGVILADQRSPVRDVLKDGCGDAKSHCCGVVERLEGRRAGPWGVRLSGSYPVSAPSQLCDMRLSLNCSELQFSHP